jgi:hypothetical protein
MPSTATYVAMMAVVIVCPWQFALWIDHGGAAADLFVIRRKSMTSKSKLGAITFIAAIGLASPAFAQIQANAISAAPGSHHVLTLVSDPPDYGSQNYAPSQTGGGSGGYNRKIETYRLKRHPASHTQ